jgi:Holliday junction resolvasome RuvABC ATP-dependent DNA helicase subunit
MTVEPDRIVSGQEDDRDTAFDRALRPSYLAGYVGQESKRPAAAATRWITR